MMDMAHLMNNDAFLQLEYKIYTWNTLIDALAPVVITELKHNLAQDPEEEEEMSDSEMRETHMNLITDILLEAWSWIATEKSLYCYLGHKYVPLSLLQFHKLVRKIWRSFRSDCRKNDSKEIYWALQANHIIRAIEFNFEDNLLPFLNGVVDLSTGALQNHNPCYWFTFCFDWHYNPDAQCPKFLATMKQMFPNENVRDRLLHYLAYCLTARIDLQIAQIWIGPPGCGKSKLLEAFAKLLGDFAMRIPLNKLCTDKRYRAEVNGKRLVWGSELGGFRMQKDPMNEVKSIITDGIIDGEKKFDDPINFTNKSKLCYTSNDTPIVMGGDQAFYERFEFIPFTVVYRGTQDEVKDYFDKLLQSEKEGIICYLISLMPNLEKVLTTPDWKTTKRIWMAYSSNAAEFVTKNCIIDANMAVGCASLYRDYVTWSNADNGETVDGVTFEKYMSALGYQIVVQMNDENKFLKMFQGIGKQ